MSAINKFIMSEIETLKILSVSRKIINHQGVKGSSNEVLLKNLLLKVIPSKYKIALNSIIQDSSGNQSNEVDLIIYSDDFLPPFFLGEDVGFLPIECVKYAIEVKTTLTKGELETTIEKFKNLKNLKNSEEIKTTLFAFSSDLTGGKTGKKTELQRYIEQDKNYMTYTPLQIICVLDKEYSYIDMEKLLIKNLMTKQDFIYKTQKIKADFKNGATLTVNGLDYDSIFYYKYNWIGCYQSENNNCLLAYLVGLSNTLVGKTVGDYLLPKEAELNLQKFSEVFIDQWGNKSYSSINYMGIHNVDLKFTLSLREGGDHSLTFLRKDN